MSNETNPANLPGNSYKNRAKAASDEVPTEKKPLARITTGSVVVRKPGIGSKLRAAFGGDDARTVGQFVLRDVVVPAIKTLLYDSFTQGLQRAIFGSSSSPIGSGGASKKNYINYGKISTAKAEAGSRDLSATARASHNFSQIIFEKREEAEEVREQLLMAIKEYQVVTVDDFYNLVGITGNFMDEQWGWDNLSTATVRLTREGWLLELPPTMSIN